MSEKVYKSLFAFYTFTGALCLKFEENEFKISKFQKVRMTLMTATVIIFTLIVKVMESLEVVDKNLPQVKLTKFSDTLTKLAWLFPLFFLALTIFFQIRISHEIAEIFNIILRHKNIFDDGKINLQIISSRSLKYFMLCAFIIVYDTTVQFASSFTSFSLKEILKFLTSKFSLCAFMAIIGFVNNFLVHLEFIVENYTTLIQNSFSTHDSNHKNFEHTVAKVYIIFDLSNIFNRSFSKILTLSISFLMTIVIFIVSLKRGDSHRRIIKFHEPITFLFKGFTILLLMKYNLYLPIITCISIVQTNFFIFAFLLVRIGENINKKVNFYLICLN